jgi:hypothetical protein
MKNEHVSKPLAPGAAPRPAPSRRSGVGRVRGPGLGARSTAPRDAPDDSKEHIAKLDDYELPPEVPLEPAKMKPNRFSGRVKPRKGPTGSAGLTHAGARNIAERKPKPESQRTVRKTVMLYRSEIRFLRSLDPNLSKAIHKLLGSKTR